MKTSELTGAALDWAVAKCEENELAMAKVKYPVQMRFHNAWQPTKYWDQGGPIIERECIDLAAPSPIDNTWCAMLWNKPQAKQSGSTPLIAAMRCYVASKLGDEIEIPEELTCTGTTD